MKILIAGATGQVGNEIIKQLHLPTSSHTVTATVTALVRRPNSIQSTAMLSEKIFNYEDPAAYSKVMQEVNPDLVICALGTTMKTAGSPTAFNRVDRDYPLNLIAALKAQNPTAAFALVSSVGADRATGVYLSAKFAVETALIKSGLHAIIARPSFLRGERKEIRPAEVIAEKVFTKPYLWIAKNLASHSKTIWKYAPVESSQVAKALIHFSEESVLMQSSAPKIIEGLDFYSF